MDNRNTEVRRNRQQLKEDLVRSGTDFISEFYPLLCTVPQEERTKYLEKVLHSIFFFGGINEPPVNPEEFIAGEWLETYKEKCPKSFEEYLTHLPMQTPFSIVLELIVKYGSDKPVVEAVREWSNRVNKEIINNFASTAVTECSHPDGVYYGASLSCYGPIEVKTMIAISCLKTWNKAIGWVVSNYNQGATLKFPPGVRSIAYRMKWKPNVDNELLAPCLKCHRMFTEVEYYPKISSGITESQNEPRWRHGNCAECESFSKLLNNDSTVSSKTEAHHDGTIEPIASITLKTENFEKEIRNVGARSFIFRRGDSLKFFC